MDREKKARQIKILLVEDNPGDVRLIKEALKEASIPNTLSVVTNGVDALAFLRREGEYASAIRPDIILLDLNLPRRDGREVLAIIKQDVTLRRIPVVVISSSAADQDITRAYDLHANCYITKPVDLEQFLQMVKTIEEFWLSIVTLPSDA